MSIATKAAQIAENEYKVYEAGYEKGKAEGGGGDTEAAYENGRKEVWNAIQWNGKRTNWSYAFYCPNHDNPIWNDNTFKPIHDIVPLYANRMFRGLGVTDMPALLTKLGIKLDFSKCATVEYLFSNSKALKKYGTFNVNVNCDCLVCTFAECDNLETIEAINLPNTCYTKWDRTFIRDYSLKNITFTGYGYIQNDIVFSDCPLSKASFTNIFMYLSTTATGKTAKFNKTAKEAAFTADEWATLVATRPNWTIALI